jgi:hypothetical protein
MGRYTCTFYNRTSHVLYISTTGCETTYSTINPEMSFLFEADPNDTYIAIAIRRRPEKGFPTIRPIFTSDDNEEWEEIVIYMPDNEGDDTWVGTKSRQPKISGQVISNPYVTKSTSILSAVCCTHDFTTI